LEDGSLIGHCQQTSIFAGRHQVLKISKLALARPLTLIRRIGFGFKSEPPGNFPDFCGVIHHM
jgi:hypothetical protein